MLSVVGTPIGNLGDITKRAVETLQAADVIYCEDTRRTKILLDHLGISKPLQSLHHHSAEYKLEEVLKLLQNGQNVAYVTDAGTPGVADPAGKLVEYLYNHGVKDVTPVPGPSAVTAILSVAGLPANSYWFAGYVPTKKGRQTFIAKLAQFPETVVLFETAPRLLKFLDQFAAVDADRVLVVGRELTKQFEQIERGTASELTAIFTGKTIKGELVLGIAPKSWQPHA